MQLLQVFGKKQVARSWYKVLWIIIICTSSFSFFILWACDLLPLTVGSTALWCDRWLPLLPLFHLIWSKCPWGAWWLINSHISWLSAWNVGFLNDSHFRETLPDPVTPVKLQFQSQLKQLIVVALHFSSLIFSAQKC